MSEWVEYTLGDLCVLIGGGTPKTNKSEYWNGDIPWLSVSDFNNGRKYCYDAEKKITELGLLESSTKILRKGQIIISARGTVGIIAMIGKDMAFNQSNYGITAVESLTTNDFLYYLLKFCVPNLLNASYGAVFDTITKNTFNQIQIDLPPLQEQKAIAAVLSSLDDKIDLLHRQNQTLEAMAETLFRQWLSTVELEEKPFSTIISSTLGGEWGKEHLEGDYDTEVNCIRGTDIADMLTGLPSRAPLRYVKKKKYDSIKPQTGDVIIEISSGTEDQSTGRCVYLNDLSFRLFDRPIVFSNFCRLIRPIRKEYSLFLYLYLNYLYKQDEFFNIENGSSGIKNLDYKYLLNDLGYLLPVDTDAIELLDQDLKEYFVKINSNKLQIKSLTALRDTLLPKLMSGEVRVKIS